MTSALPPINAMALFTREPLRCPHCRGDDIHRSRPRRGDRLRRLLGLRPYRCYECAHRFYSRRRREFDHPDAGPLPPAQETTATCPNCGRDTTLLLTPAECLIADTEGWPISCPGCGALYPLRRQAVSAPPPVSGNGAVA